MKLHPLYPVVVAAQSHDSNFSQIELHHKPHHHAWLESFGSHCSHASFTPFPHRLHNHAGISPEQLSHVSHGSFIPFPQYGFGDVQVPESLPQLIPLHSHLYSVVESVRLLHFHEAHPSAVFPHTPFFTSHVSISLQFSFTKSYFDTHSHVYFVPSE